MRGRKEHVVMDLTLHGRISLTPCWHNGKALPVQSTFQRTCGSTRTGIHIPRANACLYAFANSPIGSAANKGERNPEEFREGGLNAIPGRPLKERMGHDVVCTFRTFQHTKQHVVQRDGMFGIRQASEGTTLIVLRRTPLGALYLFSYPVAAHPGSSKQLAKLRTTHSGHFHANDAFHRKSRPLRARDNTSVCSAWVSFPAGLLAGEYSTSMLPFGLPLTAYWHTVLPTTPHPHGSR
jgi:hypothetical protein